MKLRRVALVTALVLASCSSPTASSPPISNAPADSGENTIFPRTSMITNCSPVSGSTVSSMPAFSWKATGQTLVCMAIFGTNINITTKAGLTTIGNPSDIVWMWNSSMSSGREGSVFFQQGCPVSGGQPDYTATPNPLTSGKTYTWAVWAWDASGIAVTSSSSEQYITVQ